MFQQNTLAKKGIIGSLFQLDPWNHCYHNTSVQAWHQYQFPQHNTYSLAQATIGLIVTIFPIQHQISDSNGSISQQDLVVAFLT